ncbi:MAG: protein-L-isoaspartate(D-aspartate) O-methyltransferase [Nitrososphaerales archaeon]
MPSNDDSGASAPRENLIRALRNEGILNKRVVEDAMREIHRGDFIWPGEPKTLAYLDEPLPLGDTGQTISAPHMIVMMLEALDLSSGMNVLEIGTGSGYNAALIANIVSRGVREVKEPLVITIERDKRLVEFAVANLARSRLEKIVKVFLGDGSLGYPERSEMPLYDRITIAAATPSIPQALLKQVRNNGVILAPVGGRQYQTLVRARKVLKNGKESFEKEELDGCVFVPLIGEQGFRF